MSPRSPEAHRPDLSHLDDVTGILARAVQVLRPAPRNTLDRLPVYEGLDLDVLFPAPERVPKVERSARWRLPGVVSEYLSFRSLHEPLEPEFRRFYHARRRGIYTVYARRIRPDTTSRRPRLLYIQGYMQPETLIEEFALLTTMAEKLQMEVVQLQPPYHGRRKPRASNFDGELYWTADLVQSLESLRQTLLDARTLLRIGDTSWILGTSDNSHSVSYAPKGARRRQASRLLRVPFETGSRARPANHRENVRTAPSPSKRSSKRTDWVAVGAVYRELVSRSKSLIQWENTGKPLRSWPSAEAKVRDSVPS